MTLPESRVLLVVGTRPEVIKMAPVLGALRERCPALETRSVFTGQHTTLVKSVAAAFDFSPDYDLAIMREDQTIYDVVTSASKGVSDIIRDYRPNLLLVQGDTATVFAAALAGYLEQVPLGHVEAGLRTSDKFSPWPEEGFRRLTDAITDLYFAPTARAGGLLQSENVPAEKVYVTGNTVVDALTYVAEQDLPIKNPTVRGFLESLSEDHQGILVTAHRRESFGEPLDRVFSAIRRLVEEHPSAHVIFPVHPNPSVYGPAHQALGSVERVLLTDPLDYVDTIGIMQRVRLILTDSGGIQEEAPAFGVPVLVMRDVTERPEGIEAGAAQLVGTEIGRISDAVTKTLSGPRPKIRGNPYGDGQAGVRIADIVHSFLTGAPRSTKDWIGGDPIRP